MNELSRTATILIADDDKAIRTVLTHALSRIGHEVHASSSAAGLWHMVEQGLGDIVITDVVMPDENGLDMLPRIRRLRPDIKVIVMSAQNTLLTAVKASERGAFDYLPKPFDLKELVAVVDKALAEPSALEGAGISEEGDEELPLIGRSPAMQEIYRVLARLMGTDLTVMITGESGTGKELVARALHDYGKRKERNFVAVNMAAIPRELIESELFGHEKGAFTGAAARSSGRFEQAQKGTLFLDEIGDMPLEAQTRLLRVLQEGEYVTVGGRTPIKSDVRIIAATHRDLRQLVRQGLFREDLFYRLNVVPLRLPPLRERIADVPDLVNHFFNQLPAEGLPHKSITSAAMKRLMAHRWPGNVRELENLCRRLSALYAEENLDVEAIDRELSSFVRERPEDPARNIDDESLSEAIERHLDAYFQAHGESLPPTGLYDRILKEMERPLISLSLKATGGNQIRAAEMLGLNRNTLRKKIRELDIPVVRGLRS